MALHPSAATERTRWIRGHGERPPRVSANPLGGPCEKHVIHAATMICTVRSCPIHS